MELRRDRHYGAWQYIIVPLPPKVYLHGVNAEDIGRAALMTELGRSSDVRDQNVLDAWTKDRAYSLRTTAVLSNDFKGTVSARTLPDDVAAAYQYIHMSRYVWVVELTHRNRRDSDEPSVIAEAVIDATDHPDEPQPLVTRTIGRFAVRDGPTPDTFYVPPFSGHADHVRSVIDVHKAGETS